MIKRYKKNRNLNLNQKSFYFEDYLETNKKTKFSQKNNLFQDRIYLLFFLFISLVLIFSIRIIQVSYLKLKKKLIEENIFILKKELIKKIENYFGG